MPLFFVAVFVIHMFSASNELIIPGTDTASTKSVNKTLLLQMVNGLRSKGCTCGTVYYPPAAPLLWNVKLEAAATQHSTDMYKRKYFSHVGSDGSKGGMRIERAGYKWTAYGENISEGYTSEQATIEAWIQSPQHCKNMMDPLYKEMGVGRAGNYWTQDLAAQ